MDNRFKVGSRVRVVDSMHFMHRVAGIVKIIIRPEHPNEAISYAVTSDDGMRTFSALEDQLEAVAN